VIKFQETFKNFLVKVDREMETALLLAKLPEAYQIFDPLVFVGQIAGSIPNFRPLSRCLAPDSPIFPLAGLCLASIRRV